MAVHLHLILSYITPHSLLRSYFLLTDIFGCMDICYTSSLCPCHRRSFVEGAISIDKILAEFKKRFDVNKNEMNKSDYEGIRNAFKEIYPHLYDFLEKGYLDGFRRFLLYRTLYTITHIKCVHQWEEVYVHKVGMQYLCTKCHNLVPVQLKDTFEIPANFNINEYLHQIFDEMFRRWNT
jgi:hypothetical protein